MTPANWTRLKDLFNRAREQHVSGLASFLDEHCRGEPELRRELVALLAADATEAKLEIEDRLLASEEAPSERYLPGVVIDGRYRIVGLLGHGGMGEVYRADDLKLGQPVALKFLPAELEDNAERLDMLLDEVRIARQVAHPNVCRVYDVGEADGSRFICMEFVDGENLATLLRRIGRLPRDKAAQIARQIGAGLGAAHEQGIIHRDLKPANIMIDGRGRARITDFGLARETEVVSGHAARAGTPDYMAPEQLAGHEATASSDIYALGLVLYELFTGERPFIRKTLDGAIHERSAGPPSSPSSRVESLDPAAEKVILRCLEPDPAQRPPSALTVAAALPGGDPLAAALAAGETPSPEMVASAPTEGSISQALAVGAVLFCLIGIVGGLIFEYETVLAPGGRPPIVLADRARQILTELGHPTAGHDEAWGYLRPQSAMDRLRSHPDEADAMLTGDAPPLHVFWYRSAPSALMPWGGRERVSPNNPPRGVEDSAMVDLRTDGTLLGLEVWPRRERQETPSEATPSTDTNWSRALELAGLADTTLEPTAPRLLPPMFADEQVAWRGTYPAGMERRVEGSAVGGRVTWLRVHSPETEDPESEAQQPPAVVKVLLSLLLTGILLAGAWLARGNLRSGRGDRRGAFRLGLTIGGAWFIGRMIVSAHGVFVYEVVRFWSAISAALFVGALTALFYIGLEPTLRRRWPRRIVAWTRLLDGRFRDPLVGRELLAGAVAATLFAYHRAVGLSLSRYLGLSQRHHLVEELDAAGWGVPGVLSAWPIVLAFGTWVALAFAVLTFGTILLVRSEWLGGLLVSLVVLLVLAMRSSLTEPSLIFVYWLGAVIMVLPQLRFGLLASVTMMVLAHLWIVYPATQFGDGWYDGGAPILMSTIVVVAAYGASCCARRPVPRPE